MRRMVWGFGRLLTLGVAACACAVAVAAADTPPLSEQDSVLTAPSAADAAALAAQSGQPVEVTDALTKTTATFVNPDGSYTMDLALGPVREPDSSSATGWSNIDTTLVSGASGLSPAVADVPQTFSDGGADGFLAKLGLGADQFTLGWLHALPVPVVDGARATYRDVYPGIDLVLEARPQGFEQLWVLRSRPTGPLVLNVPLGLKGLHADVGADGTLVLTDVASGQVKARSDDARMWGAERDPNSDEPTHSALVAMDVVPSGAGVALELRPDAAFLDDPSLTYPVTIDPSQGLAKSVDTYVQSDQATTDSHNETILKAGTYNGGGGVARTLMRWDTSPLNGAVVSYARLSLYEYWSWSCTPSTLELYRAATHFSSITRWIDGEYGLGAIYASTSDAKGWSSAGEGGSSACPANRIYLDTGGYSGHTLTDLVQYWASHPSGNDGVVIKAASETSNTGWKKFYSYDNASGNPILSVNYNHAPTAPTALSIQNGQVLDDGSTPLSATFNDADTGQTGKTVWTVRNAANQVVDDQGMPTTLGYSGSGAYVAAGASSSWAPELPDGVYTVTVYNHDDASTDSASVGPVTIRINSDFADSAPANGSIISGLTPTLSVTRSAGAPPSAQTDFWVYRYSDKVQVATGTVTASAPAAATTWQVPVGALQPGQLYYWQAGETDPTASAGFQISAASAFFTATTTPDVLITAPYAGAQAVGDVVRVAGSPTGFATVTSVDLIADGVLTATTTDTPYEFTWPSPHNGGAHTLALTVHGTNSAGATATATQTVTITTPTVTVTAYPTGTLRSFADAVATRVAGDPGQIVEYFAIDDGGNAVPDGVDFADDGSDSQYLPGSNKAYNGLAALTGSSYNTTPPPTVDWADTTTWIQQQLVSHWVWPAPHVRQKRQDLVSTYIHLSVQRQQVHGRSVVLDG